MSDVAILPADKGRATVLMNKEEYHSKLTQLIQSGTYRLVNKDPTNTQETKIGRIFKNLEREGKIYDPLDVDHLFFMVFLRYTS